MVDDYFAAIAEGDWAAVCETRTEAEQRSLAESTGSCEEAARVLFDSPEAQNLGELGLEQEPERVEIERDEATIKYPAGTFFAVIEDGEWKLFDPQSGSPAAQPAPEEAEPGQARYSDEVRDTFIRDCARQAGPGSRPLCTCSADELAARVSERELKTDYGVTNPAEDLDPFPRELLSEIQRSIAACQGSG